jgi:hypothetical protein
MRSEQHAMRPPTKQGVRMVQHTVCDRGARPLRSLGLDVQVRGLVAGGELGSAVKRKWQPQSSQRTAGM